MSDAVDLLWKFNPSPEDVPSLEDASCPEPNRLHNPTNSSKAADNAALLFVNVRKDVPGLAISDFPRAFLIQVKLPKAAKERGLAANDEKVFQVFTMPALWANRKAAWPYFKENFTERPPAELPDPYVKPGGWVDPEAYEVGPLKTWNYEKLAAKCAPGKEPSEYDLPNPRLYWPDGTLAYVQEPWWPHWIRGEFKRMVVALFMDPKPLLFTTREPRLVAFFDHHMKNGGNPSAFVEYVRELTVQPPPNFSAYLVDRMAYWVKRNPNRTKKQESQQALSDFLGHELYLKLTKAMNEEFEGKRIISSNMEYMLGHNSKGALVAAVDAGFAKAGKSPPPDEEYRALLTRTFGKFTLGKGKLHGTRDSLRAVKWKPVIAARLNS